MERKTFRYVVYGWAWTLWYGGQAVGRGEKVKALSFYRQSAAKGYDTATLKLGKLYYIEQDYDESFRLFQQMLNRLDGEALYMMGQIYERGKGTARDWMKARDFYILSSEKYYYGSYEARTAIEKKMRAAGMIYYGKVVDETGNPVHAASILVLTTGKAVIADYYGDFEIIGLQVGDKIIVSNINHEDLRLTYSRNMPQKLVLKKARSPKNNQTTASVQSVRTEKPKSVTSSGEKRTGTCTGTVFDKNGNPANSVWIEIKGTEIKVLTDYYGNFKLNGLKSGDIIVVSNLGKNPQTIKWIGQKEINVTLINYGRDVKTAWNGWCRGVVYKADGNPANSVWVEIEGTDTRVLTDLWGKFHLKGLKMDDYIVVSDLGRNPQRIRWTGNNRIEVYMGQPTGYKPVQAEKNASRTEKSYPGSQHGRVVSAVTGKPVIYAVVRIEGTDINVKTDMYGSFHLKGLKAGDRILITAMDYQSTALVWELSISKEIIEVRLKK